MDNRTRAIAAIKAAIQHTQLTTGWTLDGIAEASFAAQHGIIFAVPISSNNDMLCAAKDAYAGYLVPIAIDKANAAGDLTRKP